MSESSVGGDPSPPAPAIAWSPPPPEPGPAPGVAWAGYAERLVAYILDGLIVSVIVIGFVVVGGVVALVAGGRTGNVGPVAALLSFLSILAVIGISIGYFPFFWARGGQTPGMRPFGIRVVRDADGGRVTAGAAILRLLGVWVSALVLYIGFAWVFIDRRRRGWHDLIGGTVVVKDAVPR